MKRHHLALVGAACLIAPLAAACGSTTTTAKTTSLPTTAVVALPLQTSPDWFFPVLASSGYYDTNTQMYSLMYMPLVFFNNQDAVDYAQSLAEKIDTNSNGTVYTIHLNPKWKWSNGQPVTAQDVIFTWNIMKAASGNAANLPWQYGGAGAGGVPQDFKSVTALNSHTVQVTLTTPSNQTWFIHNGLGQLVVVPESVWNKYPNNMIQELTWIKSIANAPNNKAYSVIDGPYAFKSFTANEQWAFVQNPKFDGHKGSIKKIVFQYETSAAAEFSALKSGTVQVGYLPAAMWASRKSLTLDTFWPGYLWGFNMMRLDENPTAQNGLGPSFAQAYVRQAMEMGINQQQIINGIYHGEGVIEDGPVPSQPHTVYYAPSLAKPPYPYNPTAGKKLLEAHGWKEVNGVMTKNGVKFQFPLIYASGDQSITDTVQLIQQEWAKEGIKITLQSMPFSNLVATDHGNPAHWDAAYWGAGWTYQPDFYPTGGELFKTGAAANAGGYSSSTMDKLIQKSYQPGTVAQNMQALFQYEAFAVKDVPYLWFPWMATLNESASNLKGVSSTFNPIEDLYMPNYWHYSK